MSEESFVMHSAPTLAGIKTGCLFTARFNECESVVEGVKTLNMKLTPKGIRVIPLQIKGCKVLMYVYRPNSLKQDIYSEESKKLLHNLGYPTANPNQCIVCLKNRIAECDSFPHEIGLFLGYPPEDVLGFIENDAKNYKTCGTWKVYGNLKEAQKRFARYKRCTRDYCARIKEGCTIENLVVSKNMEGN